MINLMVSMVLLLVFCIYELYFLTRYPLILVNIFSIVFHLLYLDSIFLKKLPALFHIKVINRELCQRILIPTTVFFCISYILILIGKVPPAGNFPANEVVIEDNIVLCDFLSIPGCTKRGNSIVITGDITIKYLTNNDKNLTIHFIDEITHQNRTLSLRLNSPKISWIVPRCYDCRYFMNTVGPFYR